MTKNISLRNPCDFHTHLRGWNGESSESSHRIEAIMRTACSLQGDFSAVLVMPNLIPTHITNVEEVRKYKKTLLEFLPENTTPLMTISLKPETTPETIRACAGEIVAVKYYPGGVTTNSGNSSGDIDPDNPDTQAVFEEMTKHGIVLSLHPETTVTKDSHGNITKGFVHRAEREFRSLAERIALNHPDLRIVIEHISTAEMAELITGGKYPNLWGSVTPQHLLLTAHDKEGGATFEPHLHCKPTLKNPEDRLAIQRLVYSGNEKIFFGSDSAPHPQDTKESAHCASGVFSSPIALPIITEWWMNENTGKWWEEFSGEKLAEEEKIARLQHFFSENGRKLYQPEIKKEKEIALEREISQIPESYPTSLPNLAIVPMWAGKEISWREKKW